MEKHNPWEDYIENLDMSGIIPDDFDNVSTSSDFDFFLASEEPDFFGTHDDWESLKDIDKITPEEYKEAQRKGIESSIDYISYLCAASDENSQGIEGIMDESDILARDQIEKASVEIFKQMKNSKLKTAKLFTTIVMLMSFEVIQTLLKIDEDMGKND